MWEALSGWGIDFDLILTSHTWHISKNCTSRIYKQWKSDLDNSWKYFMCENQELSCWNNFTMAVIGVFSLPCLFHWGIIVVGEINHCFGNKSKSIPHTVMTIGFWFVHMNKSWYQDISNASFSDKKGSNFYRPLICALHHDLCTLIVHDCHKPPLTTIINVFTLHFDTFRYYFY